MKLVTLVRAGRWTVVDLSDIRYFQVKERNQKWCVVIRWKSSSDEFLFTRDTKEEAEEVFQQLTEGVESVNTVSLMDVLG